MRDSSGKYLNRPVCPLVLWLCWLGYLACKNRIRSGLLCVGWDVIPYTQYCYSLLRSGIHLFFIILFNRGFTSEWWWWWRSWLFVKQRHGIHNDDGQLDMLLCTWGCLFDDPVINDTMMTSTTFHLSLTTHSVRFHISFIIIVSVRVMPFALTIWIVVSSDHWSSNSEIRELWTCGQCVNVFTGSHGSDIWRRFRQ